MASVKVGPGAIFSTQNSADIRLFSIHLLAKRPPIHYTPGTGHNGPMV